MLQRSPEWHGARRGVLTASRFGDVLAGKKTKRYKLYQREIVLELQDAPVFDDNPPWFNHGRDNEAEGIGAYCFQKDAVVTDAGLIIHPDYCFIGCSPDGLRNDVRPSGGVELKCRSSLTTHLKTINAGMDSNHRPQVQGCMFVTGRDWWDFASYYVPPNRFETGALTDLHVYRVYRDDHYIDRLQTRCIEFWGEVQQQLEASHGTRSK